MSYMTDPTTKLSLKALGLTLTAAVALGACGSSTAQTDTAAAGTATASNESAAPADDSGLATTVVLPSVSGGQIDFGDLAGKDTVLWFWAPW